MKKNHYHWLSFLALVVLLCAVLSACAHKHDYDEERVEKKATCTKKGSVVRTCECGDEETEVIPEKGHKDGDWIVDSEATCTEDGSKHLACKVCDATIDTEVIPAKGTHNYTEEVTEEAACDSDGEKEFTCSDCGDRYTESFAHKTYSATEIYETYVNSVGEIITYDKSGNEYSLGTAFVYSSDGKIITNYHVIENGYSAKIQLGEVTYEIKKVLAYDKDIDLAILQISASDLVPVEVCEKTHNVGEVVYALGSSKGMTATFSDGMITYADREVDGVIYTQHDAPISSGNSGGPLINEYGEVIGINTWTVRESQNLNFAINVSEISKLKNTSPMTMAEVYQKESDPYDKMKNYIVENGTYQNLGGLYVYSLQLNISYSEGTKFERWAIYSADDDEIALVFFINDTEEMVNITVDSSLDGSYSWGYADDTDYEMSGTLYATTYDEDTLVGYDSNNIGDAELRSTIRELASAMVYYICSNITDDFSEIGVTAADLQFYCCA